MTLAERGKQNVRDVLETGTAAVCVNVAVSRGRALTDSLFEPQAILGCFAALKEQTEPEYTKECVLYQFGWKIAVIIDMYVRTGVHIPI